MQQVQWYLRVLRSRGESERQRLIGENLLDRSLRIRSDGDFLLLPVLQEIPGAETGSFDLLPEKEELPRHEQVGGIAILAAPDREQAEILLKARSNLHTVLYAESAVEGEFRVKRFSVLAGEETTRTIYIEYGHRFVIDLAEAYFSARLSGERQRIAAMMTPGETVADMFAGVGPYAIILAEKASLVYACDINPGAVSLMEDNIRLNHVTNILPVLGDACMLPALIGRKADRIIMNLPLSNGQFLDAALSLVKPGGMIHCYALVRNEDELIPLIRKYPVSSLQTRFVRSYSPDAFHVVYDIRVSVP